MPQWKVFIIKLNAKNYLYLVRAIPILLCTYSHHSSLQVLQVWRNDYSRIRKEALRITLQSPKIQLTMSFLFRVMHKLTQGGTTVAKYSFNTPILPSCGKFFVIQISRYLSKTANILLAITVFFFSFEPLRPTKAFPWSL